MKWLCVTNAEEGRRGRNLHLMQETIIGLEETYLVPEGEGEMVPGTRIICFANGTESDFITYNSLEDIRKILDGVQK